MSDGLNEGMVGDTAKLMMHRLIVRRLRRDPSLVEKAKVAHARQAVQFADWPFVSEWEYLLTLPTEELASKLISHDREMVGLRNSSPFYLAEGIHFGDYDMRVRLRRAARRIVERGLSAQTFSPPDLMSEDKKLRAKIAAIEDRSECFRDCPRAAGGMAGGTKNKKMTVPAWS
jgi:hypothetical protein